MIGIFHILVYTISEVAGFLKVNRNYVYAPINSGHLRSIKLG
ncbi:MAG: helix-turn-helix domain-containing protein [Eubacteriales bacterium]